MLIRTAFGLDEYVFEALRGRASGFLLEDAAPEEIQAVLFAYEAGLGG